MDFIDRLADILRSLMGNRSDERSGLSSGQGQPYGDPDLRAAWEELEDYMRGGPGGSGGSSSSRTGPGSTGDQRRWRPEPPVDESLRKDFANLEVSFGADIETVRRSYKVLMLRYHPDKFAGHPEKQRDALEITKRINESFERIRSRH